MRQVILHRRDTTCNIRAKFRQSNVSLYNAANVQLSGTNVQLALSNINLYCYPSLIHSNSSSL